MDRVARECLDANGDGGAEIFYFNDTGANLFSGYILRWDGAGLVAVQGPDGKPFNTFTSGYAMGGEGFACRGNEFVTMGIGYGEPPDGWSGSETIYHWSGNQLVKVSEDQPIPISKAPAGTTGDYWVPPEYDQIIGVHCPGVAPGYPYAEGGPGS